MSFDFKQLHIESDSPEGRVIETIVKRDQVTPEEAIRRALRGIANAEDNPALSGLGLFSKPEDAAAIDAAVTLAYQERRRPSHRSVGI